MVTKGAKEWSDHSVNFQIGCENNCKYCYAKGIAKRFNRATDDSWKHPIIQTDKVEKKYRKREGRIMFPTSHDLTLNNYLEGIAVLKKLLVAGNNVLITTKPNPHVIMMMMNDPIVEHLKEQILFRFTITTVSRELSEYWEPFAPSPIERLWVLKCAFDRGFKTSVSIEPYLDSNPQCLIRVIEPYITDTIWLGIMNPKYIPTEDEYIKSIYTDEWIKDIIDECKRNARGKLRLKDSIKNLLGIEKL